MEKKREDNNAIPAYGAFRFIDFLVLLVFISTAVVGILLFRHDLLQTIEGRDTQPVGIIIIRNNVVQRRYADRVIWERLFVDSPVYSGDLIRAAELSAATIHIDENQINLNENTLIRIQQYLGSGSFHVELQMGNLDVVTGTVSGIILDLMGRQVVLETETAMNAEFGEEGIVVRLNEGNAVFHDEGKSKELSEGMIVAQDTSGKERTVPSAVVTSLKPNARYLKTENSPLPVDFGWKSFNIGNEETVRLEIAGDRYFRKDFRAIDGLDNHALAVFDAGSWYWRLLLGDKVLNKGFITVAEASGLNLLSPVMNSVFRYHNSLPQIRFQWEGTKDVSHYLLEISQTPGFENPQISRQTRAASVILSAPGEGTWYWRVKPVFISVYEGEAKYSSVFSFSVVKTADTSAPVIEVPDPPPAAPPRRPSAGVRRYIVKSGDTLSRIARQVYGDAFLWRQIAEANRLENPDLIYPDQEFIIP